MKDNIVKEIREFCESNHFPRMAELVRLLNYYESRRFVDSQLDNVWATIASSYVQEQKIDREIERILDVKGF